MATINAAAFSDRDLLLETERAAARERRATSALLALIAEVDTRRLYLGEGFSSLFQYATKRLHLSEPAAYGRITAARAARRFPIMLRLVDEGALSLTTIGLLAPHLTDDNHASLLEAARDKSKREVEAAIAALHPQPDIPASIRMLPAERRPAAITRLTVVQAVSQSAAKPLPDPASEPLLATSTKATPQTVGRGRDVVAPLSPRRYLIRMTVDEETQRKLVRARDLLHHAIPDGDPGAIFDRALTLLLAQLERTKTGAANRPRQSARPAAAARIRSRHVPAAVRRAVWARDQGRCAFVGSTGRCDETGGVEYHHVEPFASGGATTVDNIQLRCRAHNAYEVRSRSATGGARSRSRRSQRQLRPDGVEHHSPDSIIVPALHGWRMVANGSARRSAARRGRRKSTNCS